MNRKIKNTIRKVFRKLSGWDEMQEEVDTLYYFLNQYADITKAGPTKDEDLRKLQLVNSHLLAVFDQACKKHGLTYWLDYGTLLGCIRHGGFIPWDDDMDVAMPREDYNRLMSLTKDEMDELGIVVRSGGYFDSHGPMERLAFAYKTLETGGWLDIFPVDHILAADRAEKYKGEISGINDRYHEIYQKHKNSWSEEQIIREKEKLYAGIPKGENEIYFHGQEYEECNDFVMDKNEIFPLKKQKFEEYEFFVPGNYDEYLRSLFGDYMSFPHSGVEHHLDPDGGKAKDRAKKHGINMDDEIAGIKAILEKYSAGA